jgi:hypothetical protein
MLMLCEALDVPHEGWQQNVNLTKFDFGSMWSTACMICGDSNVISAYFYITQTISSIYI